MSEQDEKFAKDVTSLLNQLGFVRMEDYHDNSGCPACYNGSILQFYNPLTKQGILVTVGDVTDLSNQQTLFGEDFLLEVEEDFKVKIC